MTGSADVSHLLLVSQSATRRLSAVLTQMGTEQVLGGPVTVVHPPGWQPDIDEAKAEHPAVSFVAARTPSPDALTSTASAKLKEVETAYLSVAHLPKDREVAGWAEATRGQLDRLTTVGLTSTAPLLLWTDHSSRQVVAAYLLHVLRSAQVQPGKLAAYLGSLSLTAASPRLEAIDPLGDDIELSGWLSAKFSPEMPEPPWRYRFLMAGSKTKETIYSEPTSITKRVDARGNLRWENLTARLPLHQVADGNYTVQIEVDSDISDFRTRRAVHPAKGALLNARAVAMTSTTSGETIRYLVHSTSTSKGTHLTVQSGQGGAARARWSATLVKKDLKFALRGKSNRHIRMLRLLRLLTSPLYARRKIWLVGERTDTAQDNGVHLFRHLRTAHPDRDVYYVMDPSSPQYSRVSGLGNVVAHSSWRHQLLMLHADVLANAYSIRYFVPNSWGMADYTHNLAWRTGAFRVYLKHGVHLSQNAVKRGLGGYDLFLTVMPAESQAIRAVSGYQDQIAEIGMPRYDGLIPAPSSRTVLFMPTWRQYLVPKLNGKEHAGQIPFEGSGYQRFMTELLESERLRDLLETYDYQLKFLPHYNMASRFDDAVRTADRISIADTTSTSFQDLLRECDAFITDYSSVHFDVAYLGTPIIYARFDQEDYEAKHASRSWFDYERDGFGPVTHTVEETLDALEHLLRSECQPEEPYLSRVQQAFTFTDRNNCARAVAAIDVRLDAGGGAEPTPGR